MHICIRLRNANYSASIVLVLKVSMTYEIDISVDYIRDSIGILIILYFALFKNRL